MFIKAKYKSTIVILLTLFALMTVTSAQAKGKMSIKLNKTNATIYVKSTLQLKATVKGTSKRIKWSSSNKKIAMVSSNGTVKAKKPGVVTITAKVNKTSKKCRILVKANLTDISKVLNDTGVKTPARFAKNLQP